MTTQPILPYKALALQVGCHAVNGCRSRQESLDRMKSSLQKLEGQLLASKQFIGPDLKLVVLPEYFLTGFPMQESFAEWREKACISDDDDIYPLLGKLAQKAGVYLSGNLYETDPHFPELYFQASFIMDPEGHRILRYRRLNSMYAPTPHDVLDRYLEVYGPDSLFPVADTPIGRLACIASEEILYPEIARCLAMKGAEVFCHSSSEVASALPSHKNIAKQARAIENMAYVVSANSAGIHGIAIPAASTDAHSQVVQYDGLLLCEALCGESMVASATLNLQALRHYRQRPGMGNYLSRQRFELFASTYAQSVQPANQLLQQAPQKSLIHQQQLQVIAQLTRSGILSI